MRLPTMLLALSLPLATSLLGACADPVQDTDLNTELALEERADDDPTCADHPLAGSTYTLTGRAHQVAGTLVIVDGCTLAVEDFDFDGGGLDVRAMVAADRPGLNDDDERLILSEDLRRSGGYDNARLEFPLPEGVTVDDVGAFSIWCVPVGQSFGDATF